MSISSPPPVATWSRSSSHEGSSERRFRTSRHRARDKRRPSERLARARARLLHPRTGAGLSGGSPPVAVGSAGGNQASRLNRAAPPVPADPTATSARSTLLRRTEPSAESSFRSATSTRTAVTRGALCARIAARWRRGRAPLLETGSPWSRTPQPCTPPARCEGLTTAALANDRVGDRRSVRGCGSAARSRAGYWSGR